MSRLIDLTGQQFKSWVVIDKAEVKHYSKGSVVYWLCKCENCGTEKTFAGQVLRTGQVGTCKCQDPSDLTGQRFGKVVVVKREDDYISPSGFHSASWLCLCDCGK